MKKAFLLMLLLSACINFSFGQPNLNTPILMHKSRVVKVKQPLILIGHLETNFNSLIVAADNLEIIKTITDSLALIPYGQKGQDGIILVQLKSKIPLLNLTDVLDYYKVAPENRRLKVLVDKRPINPELFLADVSLIQKIEIIKQDLTSPVWYSWNKDEEFLNIVTKIKENTEKE